MSGGVLERFQRHRGRQEVAEYDCTRHADALTVQIEVRNAVLTKRDEWDAAELSQRRVIKHHHGQLLRSIARDVVEADAVTPGHRTMVWEAQGGVGREKLSGGPREVGPETLTQRL